MTRLAFVVLLALLASCGGSDEADLATRYGLQLQAIAYEDQAPMVIFDSANIPCTQLIVIFGVKAGAGGFPDGIKAMSVSLSKVGSPAWEQVPASAETGISVLWTSDTDWISFEGSVDGVPPPGKKLEPVLRGVARGCATAAFQVGDKLQATVHLATPIENGTVSTSVTLEVVS